MSTQSWQVLATTTSTGDEPVLSNAALHSAGFVITGASPYPEKSQVVAIGTGTKCLSAQKRTCQVVTVISISSMMSMKHISHAHG